MNAHDIILIILYAIALVVVVMSFSNLILIGFTFLLVMIITIMQKIYVDSSLEKQSKKIEEMDSKRTRLVDLILQRLESFSKTLQLLRHEISTVVSSNENKIQEIRHEASVESEKQYRELAKKILDVENRTTEIKKNLGVVYSTIDERLKEMEEKKSL